MRARHTVGEFFAMSRSYKHTPCYKDRGRGMKKTANRYLRRNYLIVPSRKAYKKLFCSYDICDYKFLRSFYEYRKNYLNYCHRCSGHRSDQELYRMWYKDYKMK